jgi:hypothetical protein
MWLSALFPVNACYFEHGTLRPVDRGCRSLEFLRHSPPHNRTTRGIVSWTARDAMCNVCWIESRISASQQSYLAPQ